MEKGTWKAVVVLLLLLLPAMLCGCTRGNKASAVDFGNYSFGGIHVSDCSGNAKDLTVEKWYESETGIEVYTRECGTIWCSEGTYILFEKFCPICGRR